MKLVYFANMSKKIKKTDICLCFLGVFDKIRHKRYLSTRGACNGSVETI